MRRILLVSIFALLALLGSSALAPASHATAIFAGPTVTVTPSVVTQGGTATVLGSGFTPNSFAYVYYQQPDGTFNSFTVPTDGAGSFAVSLGISSLNGTGFEYVTAYDLTTGIAAPFFTVTVTAPITTPITSVRLLFTNFGTVGAGQVVTLFGVGFTRDHFVALSFTNASGGVYSVLVKADDSGDFAYPLTSPSLGCGADTVTAYDTVNRKPSAPLTLFVFGC